MCLPSAKGIPRLDARGGVGVSRKEIDEFLRKAEG